MIIILVVVVVPSTLPPALLLFLVSCCRHKNLLLSASSPTWLASLDFNTVASVTSVCEVTVSAVQANRRPAPSTLCTARLSHSPWNEYLESAAHGAGAPKANGTIDYYASWTEVCANMSEGRPVCDFVLLCSGPGFGQMVCYDGLLRFGSGRFTFDGPGQGVVAHERVSGCNHLTTVAANGTTVKTAAPLLQPLLSSASPLPER